MKPTEVVIAPSMLNAYATIERACITAMNACAKAHATDQLKQFQQLKSWAESQYIYCVDELTEKGLVF